MMTKVQSRFWELRKTTLGAGHVLDLRTRRRIRCLLFPILYTRTTKNLYHLEPIEETRAMSSCEDIYRRQPRG